MKTLRLIVFIGLFFPITLLAQAELEKEITLPRLSLQVKEIIQAIQEQTLFHFSYGSTVPLSGKITPGTTKATVSNLLVMIRQQTGIMYKVNGNKIILIPPVVKHTISGYVRDAQSGENLIGANVYILPSLHGTLTNAYGYYSLTLPADSVTLVTTYTGYDLYSSRLLLREDTVINVGLQTRLLTEVVITSSETEPIHELTQMSAINLPVQQLKSLPAMGGEADIMKSLQLLPGIQAGDEGSSGLYVRGGGPDQNLILLDGVPVYNASHLFGFFSVFNADAINHVELIKGGFPARYGGRLSSVIDISMKEGSKQEVRGEGSVGLLASRLTLEGPIKKDRSSFIISGRRTYVDLLAKPFTKDNYKVGYYFYDLNTKLNYIFNDRNRLYLSAYSGKDKGFSTRKTSTTSEELVASEIDNTDLQWGNITAAVRWNSVVSPKLFSNFAATYSRYRLNTFSRSEDHKYYPDGEEYHQDLKRFYQSGIQDTGIRADFDFTPSPYHSVRFGAYATDHLFNPGVAYVRSADDTVDLSDARIRTLEFGTYAEDDLVISKTIKANAGIHFSGLKVNGKTFLSLQPRFSLRYRLSERLSLKASYAHMTQYIHLLTNAGIGLPTDLWLPATSKIKPQRSVQVAAGAAYVPNTMYELTLEAYYKTMNGVIEYKDGASYIGGQNSWEDKVESGKGTSYGAELFVQKKQGKTTGWIGYTLSRSYRQFDNINFGRRFFYRYDRRHDVEINVSRKLKKNIDFSSTWVYATGAAVSIPLAEFATRPIGDEFRPEGLFRSSKYYVSRNGHRMRAYHRLDMSLSFRKTKKWGERSWVVSVYNVYSRLNPYYIALRKDPNTQKTSLLEYSLFPIIPSIAYNVKF